MRAAFAIPIGLALVLAPAGAGAEPPRLAMRLEYARAPGGERCPADASDLRAELGAHLGYDPFERTDVPERLSVTMIRRNGGFRAHVERFNASGERTLDELFPERSAPSCAALTVPLASYLRVMIITTVQPTPPTEPAPPAEPPRAPAPPPEAAAPRTAPVVKEDPRPEPPPVPEVPNPARKVGVGVALSAYGLAVVFAGLGVAWTVDAQGKTKHAQTIAAQVQAQGGQHACAGDSPSGLDCAGLVSAYQSADAAGALRNTWFAVAGALAAGGIASTAIALALPGNAKRAPAVQLSLRPGGVVVQGTFW